MRAYTKQQENGSLNIVGVAPDQIELSQVFSFFSEEEVEITIPDEQTMVLKKRKVG